MECSACCEKRPPAELTIVDRDVACLHCVRGLFEAAAANEHCWPPLWGSTRLDIDEHFFIGIAFPELVYRYKEKQREYSTAPYLRVYCKMEDCGAFVGRLTEIWTAVQQDNHTTSQVEGCSKCKQSHCMTCGYLHVTDHKCSSLPGEDEEQAFQGMVRGIDYQICPYNTCRRRMQLMDGCNEVVCRCGMTLCFVCGDPAEPYHWMIPRSQGGCPKWNHPSAHNAAWQLEMDLGDDEDNAAVWPEDGILDEFVGDDFDDRESGGEGEMPTIEEDTPMPLIDVEVASEAPDGDMDDEQMSDVSDDVTEPWNEYLDIHNLRMQGIDPETLLDYPIPYLYWRPLVPRYRDRLPGEYGPALIHEGMFIGYSDTPGIATSRAYDGTDEEGRGQWPAIPEFGSRLRSQLIVASHWLISLHSSTTERSESIWERWCPGQHKRTRRIVRSVVLQSWG